MAVGETISGYKILREFTTVGGGLCRWTFAEKNGVSYFLKEFLSPKYPRDDSPGSEKVKAQKRKRCERFENHQRSLKKAISGSVGSGGNLIATIDFFRSGTTYYKVTEKVDIASLTPEDISRLPIERRILVLKTVAHSLMVLHQLSIVHGDLKPDNILIKQTKAGDYIAKLIDFDNSYFSNAAPEISDESDIVGTPDYYSPELGHYIKQDGIINSSQLDTASDIFALGIIYAQYLTGKKPAFDTKYRYAWEAANAGLSVGIVPPVPAAGHLRGRLIERTAGSSISAKSADDTGLPESLTKLVNAMLNTDPKNRPVIRTVFLALKNWDKSKSEKTPEKPTLVSTSRFSPEPGSAPKPPAKSGLTGTMTKKK